MTHSLASLIPPLLVLSIAITTRKIVTSLIIGIISAALIAKDFNIFQSIKLIWNLLLEESQITHLWNPVGSSDHLYTFTFLIFLGIIISLITKTGGIAAYSNWIKTKLKTQKSVEMSAILLAPFFFIDDYLNTLTVGCIIKPLTDKFNIPRVKLAFLLDIMSSPLCVLIPASSWVAMIVANLKTSGISESATSASDQIYIKADPFSVYLATIPYIFYAIFAVITALIIVHFRISYGPMSKQEKVALETGNLFGGKNPIEIEKEDMICTVGSLSNFLIPLGSFIGTTIGMLLYTGGWSVLGGNQTFVQALQQSDSFYSLFMASVISILTSITYFVTHNIIDVKSFFKASHNGFNLMKGSLLVLLLAWTLGDILKDDLQAGTYLADILMGSLPLFLIPLVIFATSTLVCASTGSGWGTISIMAPLSIPLVALNPEHAYLIYPVIGSLLSGALVGGHISPITDATIISSTSATSYHMDHVTTQIHYVIPPIVGTVISIALASFLNISYWINFGISFAVGLSATAIILFMLHNKQHKKPGHSA
jgi:Na+/H+ antiporter NhaC